MSDSTNTAAKEQKSAATTAGSDNFELTTPVLLLTFKRLKETKCSFEQVRKARPRKLYIAGDGPRKDRPGEAEKVQETREYILNNVDWDCEVQTLLREENLGCRRSNSSAVEWLFQNEETGIIIEDDVVVSQDFFRYAQELLTKYKDTEQIMCITADNFQNGNRYNNDSYYFSQIPHCWGWASWRSSWQKYREVEQHIPELVDNIRKGRIPQFTHNKAANYMWSHNLLQTYSNNVDSWAYIWTLANLYFQGLTCTPSVNLAKHIGYGEDSTHIKQPVEFSLIEIEKLHFPLQHPDYITCLQQADDFAYKRVFFIDRFSHVYQDDTNSKTTKSQPEIKPEFAADIPAIHSIYSQEQTTRESQTLFSKYLRSPRYQPTIINFLDYTFDLPDAQSFIWQFKDIFEFENYKFQPQTRNPVIIDCGANVGTSCLYFSKTYPNSHIFAFEPDKKVYSYLQKNLKNNRVENITLFNSAVWTRDCELEFSSEGADGGTLLLSSNNMIKVKAVRLNDFLSQFSYIDFLKLDIEGVEDIVLKDCISNLHKIENLFIEYHSFYGKKQNYDELLKILTANNFRYYTTTANNIPRPFFNKNRYGTMDLQINIYATHEPSAAESIINNSTTHQANGNTTLERRRSILTRHLNPVKPRLLNLGCGTNFHPQWTNIDFTSTGKDVIAHNLLNGIPAETASYDVIYHSHVLEHFPKDKAENFLRECFRVLKPGGLLRIAVPDLEQIARLYLEKLEQAVNGNTSAESDYDWMMLELFDQTVRNQSGGDMQQYLGSDALTNLEFIRQRIGIYADSIRNSCLNASKHHKTSPDRNLETSPENLARIGAFRMGGEVHQWMYDRFSLRRLLERVGFSHIGTVSAYESSFSEFSSYNLDVRDGNIIKADSLFIEAIKPDSTAADNNSVTTAKKKSGVFLDNGGIKVVTLSSKDSGGAGGAARRMHEAILKAGADAVMIVLDKATTSERVAEVEIPIPGLDKSQPSAQLFYAFNLIQQRLSNYPDRKIPSMFTSTEAIINFTDLAAVFEEADIIHIHWIDGFFDYKNAPQVFRNKKIVWTLHDMYQFTGGCHYALDCQNYTTGCAGCPQLGQPDSCNFTKECIQIKAQTYNQLDINIVSPSKWLKDCAGKSKLMQRFPSRVIPNTFDTSKFTPQEMQRARNKFEIPADKCVILFGADHILNPVKNLAAILDSLKTLTAKGTINPETILLVLFGAGKITENNYPFKIQQLGKINTPEDMAYVYSCADFLVLPSIADNFPNIMCEALACGTPVVGFSIGGLPDLITHEATGYLASPFSTEEIQQGIVWGINTARGNSDIRLKCRNIVETSLTEDIIAAKMLAYYNELLSGSADNTGNKSPAAVHIISGNDTLRTEYINAVLSADTTDQAGIAAGFTQKISGWLNTVLLPHRNLSQEETLLKDQCCKILKSNAAGDNDYLQALLLAVVLIPAEELPLTINIYKQPETVQSLLTLYIFSFKELANSPGFTETAAKHIQAYLQMLTVACNKNPTKAGILISSAFTTLKKLSAYCATGGLYEIMKSFAELMQRLLVINKAAVNFTFTARNPKSKIRLGILLQGLSEHTETYATLPAFIHLDREKYEITVFVLRITNSGQEQQYKKNFDHLVEISATDIPKSVRMIREKDLDILLIGTNITALANHNALIATHRLARIQAVHFCNPCTTGLKNVDYFITGNNFNLKQQDFTEKLIFTQYSGVCFEGNTVVKPAAYTITRKDLGLPDNATVFITGANFYKFTYELKEFWAKLLKEIPNSYLLTLPFGPAWTNKYPVTEFITAINKQLQDNDVDPARIIIMKPLPTREDVRQAVGVCDIYLDSFPYSGATSLLDPLYNSLPVVCMKTETIRGGQGSGMLEDIGLTELIAKTEAEYLAIVKRLVNDTDYRTHISNTIKEHMENNPPFLNTHEYSIDMDRIYTQMLTDYENSTSAASNTPETQDCIQEEHLKPNDPCSCGSGLKYKKCCGKKQ